MTDPCFRCWLRGGECRPLAGQPCGRDVPPHKIRVSVRELATHGAAVVLNHRTQEAVITPIVVVNFQDEP